MLFYCRQSESITTILSLCRARKRRKQWKLIFHSANMRVLVQLCSFLFIENRKLFCVFSSTTNHQTKLPYNLYINNANNKNHQQQHHQNVQNERKIDDHLAFNHDHYQLNGINRRQRFKRAANNLFEDNELLANYESSQNDGNNNK